MPNLSYLARIPSLSSSDFIFFFVLAIFCTSSFTDWPSHLFYLRNSAWMPIVVARGYVCDSLFLPLLFFSPLLHTVFGTTSVPVPISFSLSVLTMYSHPLYIDICLPLSLCHYAHSLYSRNSSLARRWALRQAAARRRWSSGAEWLPCWVWELRYRTFRCRVVVYLGGIRISDRNSWMDRSRSWTAVCRDPGGSWPDQRNSSTSDLSAQRSRAESSSRTSPPGIPRRTHGCVRAFSYIAYLMCVMRTARRSSVRAGNCARRLLWLRLQA